MIQEEITVREKITMCVLMLEIMYRKDPHLDTGIKEYVNHVRKFGIASDKYYYSQICKQFDGKTIKLNSNVLKVIKEAFKCLDICIAKQISVSRLYFNNPTVKPFDTSSDNTILWNMKCPDTTINTCLGLKYVEEQTNDPNGINVARFYGISKLSIKI